MLKVSIAITIDNREALATQLDTLSNSLILLLTKTHVDSTSLCGSHFLYSETHFQNSGIHVNFRQQ